MFLTKRDFNLLPSTDLYSIFEAKVHAGEFCYHPHTWFIHQYYPLSKGSNNYKDLDKELLVCHSLLIGGVQVGYSKGIRPANKYPDRLNKKSYYLCDRYIAKQYLSDMEKLKLNEKAIQDSLELRLNRYAREANVGISRERVDLMSAKRIVEIKKFENWKHALGQMLFYSWAQPDKKKLLILFKDEIKSNKVKVVREVCSYYKVDVGIINRTTCLNEWLMTNEKIFLN